MEKGLSPPGSAPVSVGDRKPLRGVAGVDAAAVSQRLADALASAFCDAKETASRDVDADAVGELSCVRLRDTVDEMPSYSAPACDTVQIWNAASSTVVEVRVPPLKENGAPVLSGAVRGGDADTARCGTPSP